MERISLEVIDTDFLDELLDGDGEFGLELLQTFLESAIGCLEEARSLLSRGAPASEASRPFHTLKGAAISVGLIRVHALALAFEKRIEAGAGEVKLTELVQIEEEIERGRQSLLVFLNGSGQGATLAQETYTPLDGNG